MKSNFQERFKGRISLMNKDGITSIIETRSTPVNKHILKNSNEINTNFEKSFNQIINIFIFKLGINLKSPKSEIYYYDNSSIRSSKKKTLTSIYENNKKYQNLFINEPENFENFEKSKIFLPPLIYVIL